MDRYFYVLLGVGAVNTAISAYYYLRVVRAMLLDEPENRAPLASGLGATIFLVVLVAFLIAAGVLWEPLIAETTNAARSFTVR